MGSDGRWYLAAASEDAAPVELSCFDDIIGVTLAAELRHACGVRAANLVVLLVKSGCSGTSNDQQTLPLLAKKPWWSMVVGSGGKSGLIGCRSAVREAREPRQIRAPVLILNSKVVAGKSAPWRAGAPNCDTATHVRLTSVSRRVARQWRTGRRCGRRRRGRTRRQAEALLL